MPGKRGAEAPAFNVNSLFFPSEEEMRSNRRASWIVTVALVLAASAAAWSQEVKGKPAAPANEPAGEPLGITLGIGYSLWVSDLKFESESATTRVEYDLSSESGVEIFGQMEVDDEWSVRLGGEFLFATDVKTMLCTLGVVYTPAGLLDEPMDLHFRAGILFGSHDMTDVEGDFGTSVGVEAGVGLTYWIHEYVEGLGLQIEAMARYLKFDFDKDETVIKSDDEVGGFGVRFLAGVVYKF